MILNKPHYALPKKIPQGHSSCENKELLHRECDVSTISAQNYSPMKELRFLSHYLHICEAWQSFQDSCKDKTKQHELVNEFC